MASASNNGAPTPRRSGRIGSRAGSVAAESAITFVTSGGSRQRRSGPLTKVKPRKSSAYGATGRVGAAEDISFSETGFAQAFENQRGNANGRDEDNIGNGNEDDTESQPQFIQMTRRSAQMTPARSRATPGMSFMESEENTPDEDDVSTSGVDTSKSFGPRHEAGMMSFSPPGRRVPATPARRSEIEQSVDELIAEERLNAGHIGATGFAEQERKHEQSRIFKLKLKWAGGALASLLIFGWLLLFAFSSASPDSVSRASKAVTVINSRLDHAFDKVLDFIKPPTGPTEAELFAEFKGGNDDVMWNRMYKLNTNVEKRYADIAAIIADLKNHLPDYMVVRRHQDGSSEISDEFWRALINKAQSTKDDPEWFRYLEENEIKLNDILTSSIPKSDTDASAQAISRQEFTLSIERMYQNISARVDEQVLKAMNNQIGQLRSAIDDEARKALLDNIHLASLAQANLIANYELHLTKPNYFSSGLGAIVDPDLTSQTFYHNRRSFVGFSHRLTNLAQAVGAISQRNPPKVALTNWQEPGDCWCSAPTTASVPSAAQIAVNLGLPVIPKKVTIEHIPSAMIPTGNISNAPRQIEFWVQTTQHVHTAYSNSPIKCGSGPESGNWACLGSFTYDINASNHVQTFDLEGETNHPVDKVMMRVVTNWGADHTCLYRVRLHGMDQKEYSQYT